MKIQKSECRHYNQAAEKNKQNTKKEGGERKNHCNRWMKCSVIKHHIVSEVVNVARQNCFLHCTYNWASWHSVLPVAVFRSVDVMCKLNWIVLRNKIQLYILWGVSQQSVFPERYHFWWGDSFYSSCDIDLLQFFNQRLAIILLDATFYSKFSVSFNNRGAKRKERFFGTISFLTQNNNCFGIQTCQLHAQRRFHLYLHKGSRTTRNLQQGFGPSIEELLRISLILSNYIHINQDICSGLPQMRTIKYVEPKRGMAEMKS